MKIKKNTLRRKIFLSSFFSIFIILLVMLLFWLNVFERLELLSYDLRFVLRGEIKAPDNIILLTIDENDKKFLKKNIKSWSRKVYAKLIRKLSDAGAVLITLDMDFSMPTNSIDDEQFKNAIAYSGRVVSGRSLNNPPMQMLREYCIGEGVYDLKPDIDGVIRKQNLKVVSIDSLGRKILQPPLALELAQLILFPTKAPSVRLTPTSIVFNDVSIPSPLYINYSGPPWTYTKISFNKVYNDEFRKDFFKGKIVLIGNTDPLAHDYFSTPFPSKNRDNIATIGRMSGLEIHANIFNTIVNKKFIHRTNKKVVLLILFIGGLFLALLFSFAARRTFLFGISLVGFLSLIVFLSNYVFQNYNIWLDTIPILTETILIFIVVAITHWRLEIKERNKIRSLFGKYVSPQIAELLVQNPELIAFEGKKAKLTIFFSDIRGFTSMSETMDPQDISAILNEYFAKMTRILFSYDGTLDKFMGDAIMAFFGNPNPYTDHAFRAIAMSLEMMKAVEVLNKEFKNSGKKTINIGIGINTGEVTVGNLGSEEYFDYTVIGDDVNLACRLESIAGPGQIIISKKTYNEVSELIIAEKCEPVKVKGKEKPVEIYEVLGLKQRERT